MSGRVGKGEPPRERRKRQREGIAPVSVLDCYPGKKLDELRKRLGKVWVGLHAASEAIGIPSAGAAGTSSTEDSEPKDTDAIERGRRRRGAAGGPGQGGRKKRSGRSA
jgi:hypothetical protein